MHGALRISFFFMLFKNSVIGIKVTFPSKPEFYQMNLRQIVSKLAY